MIHKDTGELITDSTMQEDRSDRTVHASAERHDDLLVTYLSLDRGDAALDERLGRPLALDATERDEVVKELRTLLTVMYLWVKLYAPSLLALYPISGILHRGSRGNHLKAFGKACNRVTVRHPDRVLWREPSKQWIVFVHQL